MKIMFICTGNICRSAMAEGVARKIFKENNLDIIVYSCGTFAETGEYATYNAIEAAQMYDVDITSHRATNIKDSKIDEMDIILCATKNHKNMVINMKPELKEKVYTMKEFAKLDENGKDTDIEDPWGYGMDVYKNCIKEIYECIEKSLNFFEMFARQENKNSIN